MVQPMGASVAQSAAQRAAGVPLSCGPMSCPTFPIGSSRGSLEQGGVIALFPDLKAVNPHAKNAEGTETPKNFSTLSNRKGRRLLKPWQYCEGVKRAHSCNRR